MRLDRQTRRRGTGIEASALSLLLLITAFSLLPATVCGQEFKLFGRTVQVHGFASQGYVHTDDNNWLTMNTSHLGSGDFTDFATNASLQINDKLRIGAQFYDRDIGALGRWYPSLDWAMADYRFKNWLGFRGGKVKTTAGLYTDTQDLDFLHPFALLPQSVYPIDMRDATIGHVGGDVYGQFSLPHKIGDLAYTAFVGHREDSLHSGYPYLMSQYGRIDGVCGLQHGVDLRWKTPLRGLLVGASRIDEDMSVKGTTVLEVGGRTITMPFTGHSRQQWANQFYAQYTRQRWEIESEFRRYFADVRAVYFGQPFLEFEHTHGWYVAGAYRVAKRLQLGSYYSHYTVASTTGGTDSSVPGNHVFDKVVAARIDLNRFWNVKIEGHFMDGYGSDGVYPVGFYPQQNPNGFDRGTVALVIKTSVNF
jgi:hypothetical protein